MPHNRWDVLNLEIIPLLSYMSGITLLVLHASRAKTINPNAGEGALLPFVVEAPFRAGMRNTLLRRIL